MKIIKKDLKKNEITIKTTSSDDTYYLSQILESKDLVQGKTFRKIKANSETERAKKTTKKAVFLEIALEKIEFAKSSHTLRLSGTITQAPDDITKGSYHTISVDENTQLKIKKQKFLQYQIDKLDEAASDKVEGIMVVVFDREEAYFALLKKFGYTLLSELKGKVQKKADMDSNTTNFYQEIYAQIQEYFQRYNLDQIIVASPSFWKEYLMKEVKDDNIKKKIIQATCSSADRSGINEVLKREELQQALKNQKAAKELQIVERLLAEIAKGDKATYGLKGTTEALNIGATKSVLITDNLIFKKRDEESTEIEDLLKIADSTKTDVHIISSDHDGGKKLDGLGGIAAILRYKIT